MPLQRYCLVPELERAQNLWDYELPMRGHLAVHYCQEHLGIARLRLSDEGVYCYFIYVDDELSRAIDEGKLMFQPIADWIHTETTDQCRLLRLELVQADAERTDHPPYR